MKLYVLIFLQTSVLLSMNSVPMLKALAARSCVEYEVNIDKASNDIKEIINLYENNLSTLSIQELEDYKKTFLQYNDYKKVNECVIHLAVKRINKRPKEIFKEVLNDMANKRWLDPQTIEHEWNNQASSLDIQNPELVLEIQNNYFNDREKQYNHYRIGLAISCIAYSVLMSGVILVVFWVATEGRNND